MGTSGNGLWGEIFSIFSPNKVGNKVKPVGKRPNGT
jgi:hypothetical protein